MRSPTRFLSITGATVLAAALAACGTPEPYGAGNYPVSQPAPGATYPAGTYASQPGYVEYGRITNVSLVRAATGPSSSSGAGTVIGAVVGGALGNQVGSGGGRAAATILGAVGGALVGNRIANNTAPNYATTGAVYRVSVQTDSGQMRTYDVSSTGDLRPGDRVRIENGVIYLA
ncbi:MAG TPA: glycine zipper 2TM domain-containing protein [Ramlibacter sp.]|nr:glycine zipper 2TM domain-containing protein [Ramlibacter sp.]